MSLKIVEFTGTYASALPKPRGWKAMKTHLLTPDNHMDIGDQIERIESGIENFKRLHEDLVRERQCYTHIHHPGHFRVLSEKNGKVTLVDEHKRKQFNVSVTDLRTCGCGRWKWAGTQGAKR